MKNNILEIEHILHNLENKESCIVEITVLTDSMQPLIKPGKKYSFLLVRETAKIGNVTLYKVADKLCCHRIVEEISGGYITKGDNCLFPDKETINSENVLGVLILDSARQKIVNIIQLLKMRIYKKYPIFVFYNYHKKSGGIFKHILSRCCMFWYK